MAAFAQFGARLRTALVFCGFCPWQSLLGPVSPGPLTAPHLYLYHVSKCVFAAWALDESPCCRMPMSSQQTLYLV